MWEALVINSLLSILRIVVKNEQKRKTLKDRLLEVRNAINAAYVDDPDFN